jgi:putative ABC transport system permease protein
MIKVKNRKAVRNLADKSFRANRARNIIAIIAIALTAVLFTTLFTMGTGTVESLQKATMRQAGGDGHAVLKYITDEEFNHVKDHPLIKEIAYNRTLCDDVENEIFLKRRAEFWYYDDVGLKLGFCEPTSGHKPVAENEVIADTKTLELMGVPLEVGAPLTLTLDIHGETVQRDFVLAGWWESDPVFNVGQIFASRAYVDAHLDELRNTYKEDYSLTGVICAHIMFSNSTNLEGKLERVITESGYSSVDPNAPNFIENNVNWSYLSTNFGMDAGTLVALLSGLLLIVFTGYLIIYNIFQISVIRDIRFYGLLKTIGTTGRQIRRIIRRQALILSIVGIPVGLIAGFFIGKALVPLLMNNSSYAGSAVSVSPNPWIFIGSALFAVVTVLISTFKPGRIAAAVSPVEAVRFTDTDTDKKLSNKQKKTTGGGRMPRMALSNLGRNRKRTVLVIISLSLSLVLLNTVYTLSKSIDMDKYLSKFVDTDFLIAHADYFNNDFCGPDNQTTESYIQAVEAQAGFGEGGRLYGGTEEMFAVEDGANTEEYNRNADGDAIAMVYGLEDLPLNRLELIDGELDIEKLKSGKYILEGIQLDDNNVPEMDTKHFEVGDTVTLHNYKGTSETFSGREYTTQKFIVLGHVAIKYYSNSDRTGWEYSYYLPAEVYKTLVAQPAVMSYAFNVYDDQESAMESFLQSYTDTKEPLMNFNSKFTAMSELSGLQNTVVMIGGALSLIIGLIGILNFINAILTSILTRRREFAMLQSIGMTQKQLRNMLIFEGLSYTLGTCVLSLLFGTVFSLLIVKSFCGLLWFVSFHFILWPLIAVLPALIILGVIIPLISYAMTDKQSIVERLRDAE